MTSLVDASPLRMIEGEKRPVKGEQGELRRPEGEGGRRRAVEAGGRGRPEEREGERRSGAWAGGPMGNMEESCEGGGGRDLVRAGEIFLVLF